MGARALRIGLAIAMLATAAWPPATFADQDGARGGGTRHPSAFDISGTWLIEVTPRDCVSGAALGVFPVMNSFIATGTVIEYGTTPMVTPAKRTPGFGNWQRVGMRRFHAVFSLFVLPDGVNIEALHRIERTITMAASDRFTADSRVKIMDPAGEIQVATACASETGRRIS